MGFDRIGGNPAGQAKLLNEINAEKGTDAEL